MSLRSKVHETDLEVQATAFQRDQRELCGLEFSHPDCQVGTHADHHRSEKVQETGWSVRQGARAGAGARD